ncbi:hypothetical protein RYX36_028873 [Vicia faba]
MEKSKNISEKQKGKRFSASTSSPPSIPKQTRSKVRANKEKYGPEEADIDGPKLFDDTTVKLKKYRHNDKGEYHYQEGFCIIYEEKYQLVEEAPKGYVPRKTTSTSSATSASSLTLAIKEYLDGCVSRVLASGC